MTDSIKINPKGLEEFFKALRNGLIVDENKSGVHESDFGEPIEDDTTEDFEATKDISEANKQT